MQTKRLTNFVDERSWNRSVNRPAESEVSSCCVHFQTKMSQTLGQSQSLSKTSTQKRAAPVYLGRLQPVTSRLPAKPMVDFTKGGSDFRCPQNTTSFGRQVLSGPHRNSEAGVKFAMGSRFSPSATLGVGPAALAPASSMKRQATSNRRSAESCSFGTSDRDSAWRLYAIYTDKRF